MEPRQFEQLVCKYFIARGYDAVTTPYSNDYGVDVFASKEQEKIAIQAKMYGGTTRKINRQMVMELHGAKDYFDCTKAIIATDGKVLPDAITVADKLKIEILYFDSSQISHATEEKPIENTFECIWEKYIIPLEGQTLTRATGKTNKILKVDWSGIERITSNGNEQKIKVEIFKQTVNKLLQEGFISRNEINQNYPGRASSGILLVLSQVPFFQLIDKPAGLKHIK